jgi:hypothetical protein
MLIHGEARHMQTSRYFIALEVSSSFLPDTLTHILSRAIEGTRCYPFERCGEARIPNREQAGQRGGWIAWSIRIRKRPKECGQEGRSLKGHHDAGTADPGFSG